MERGGGRGFFALYRLIDSRSSVTLAVAATNSLSLSLSRNLVFFSVFLPSISTTKNERKSNGDGRGMKQQQQQRRNLFQLGRVQVPVEVARASV